MLIATTIDTQRIMRERKSLNLKPIQHIRNPNSYIVALLEEYNQWAFPEEVAPQFKGRWRSEVFCVEDLHPLDLEIGTGNGLFFAHQALSHPERCLVGIERKFKPLIQSIRRSLQDGARNARMVRYDAEVPWNLFDNNELNNIFIHFPDPWPKYRWHKNRLIQAEYLNKLFKLQNKGSFLEFKTDHKDYFTQALKLFNCSPYQVIEYTHDLHQSEFNRNNFITQFESFFVNKGQPIYYAKLEKPL